MSTTRPAKNQYSADEMRARGDLFEQLLDVDGHFDSIQRHNHRRFEITEHDGRKFHIVIEDVKP